MQPCRIYLHVISSVVLSAHRALGLRCRAALPGGIAAHRRGGGRSRLEGDRRLQARCARSPRTRTPARNTTHTYRTSGCHKLIHGLPSQTNGPKDPNHAGLLLKWTALQHDGPNNLGLPRLRLTSDPIACAGGLGLDQDGQGPHANTLCECRSPSHSFLTRRRHGHRRHGHRRHTNLTHIR